MKDVTVDGGDLTGRSMVEGFARVVDLKGGRAWLEIEPTAGCGSCAARAGCGVSGKFRGRVVHRFSLPDDFGARPGERVVVGIAESALLRASAIAYVIPLLAMLAAAVLAERLGAGDGLSALAALAGFLVGVVLARRRAAHLAAAGTFSPIFLRSADHMPAACAYKVRS